MFMFDTQKMLKGTPAQGTVPSGKEAISKTLWIAWPSILESFLISLVGFIDTIMVSSCGEAAIASVGLTTQPKFIGLAIFISLNVAVSAIVARRKGENDRESANRVLVQATIITVLLTAIVSTVCVLYADPIIDMAGSKADTHGAAVTYFQIIMGGMLFNVISMVLNAAQRGAGNTKIAMRTNIVSNGVNIIFNYILINGHLGFPALGTTGAAIATVIGSVFACIMSIISVSHKDQFISLRGLGRFRFDRKSMGAIANIGSSTLVEQLFMRVGFMLYAIIVADLGTLEFAAHNVGMNILSISFSFGDGLSAAAVSLVGQSLGEKREDLAKIYGSVSQRFGLIFAVGLSIIFMTLGQPIFKLFSEDTLVLKYGSMIMYLLTVVVFLQISQVIYSGCLRGAGDTRYTAFVSLISVAIIRPGIGYLFCVPLHMGLFGAWLGLAVDQLARFVLTWLRFKSGKWMKIKI